MMRCRFGRLKIVAAIVLMCAVRTSLACSCLLSEGVAEEAQRADAVIDATVLAIDDRYVGWRKLKVWFQQRFGNPVPNSLDGGLAIRLRVHQVWKGEAARELVLYTWRDAAGCGFQFELGRRYLVYASLIGDDEYEASLCSRTALSSDGDDAAQLTRLMQPKSL